jgi:DNA invertase Pin-like site-specific DNA recombinase
VPLIVIPDDEPAVVSVSAGYDQAEWHGFISPNESIDTGRMVFTVMAAVAELERSIITERGQAG